MRNAINHYYSLVVTDIHQSKDKYYFNQNGTYYFLVPYKEDPKEISKIYKIHLYILNAGYYIHQIVLNRTSNIITIISDTPYVLLKTDIQNPNKKIQITNILNFSSLIIDNYFQESKQNDFITDLTLLWSSKNDYLEYQNKNFQQNKILKETFDYYIGLAECAVQLIESLKGNNFIKVIAHKRVGEETTIFEFYNPLNLIIDTRIRDIAEYFKNNFFTQTDPKKARTETFNNIKNHLTNSNYNYPEMWMFFARMLYPTYYFDIYEKPSIDNQDQQKLKKIIKAVDEYEYLLRDIYAYYKKFMTFPPIEWLE